MTSKQLITHLCTGKHILKYIYSWLSALSADKIKKVPTPSDNHFVSVNQFFIKNYHKEIENHFCRSLLKSLLIQHRPRWLYSGLTPNRPWRQRSIAGWWPLYFAEVHCQNVAQFQDRAETRQLGWPFDSEITRYRLASQSLIFNNYATLNTSVLL